MKNALVKTWKTISKSVAAPYLAAWLLGLLANPVLGPHFLATPAEFVPIILSLAYIVLGFVLVGFLDDRFFASLKAGEEYTNRGLSRTGNEAIRLNAEGERKRRDYRRRNVGLGVLVFVLMAALWVFFLRDSLPNSLFTPVYFLFHFGLKFSIAVAIRFLSFLV